MKEKETAYSSPDPSHETREGGDLVPYKTEKEAVEVRDKLFKEARKLVDLAEKFKGAQIVCQGGGCTDKGISSFVVGCVTKANRIRFLLQQIQHLDEQELSLLLDNVLQLKEKGQEPRQ